MKAAFKLALVLFVLEAFCWNGACAFSLNMMMTKGTAPKRLVVVGGGIGGLSSAFDAKHNLRTNDEVIVVSDRKDFQFTPSNPWVGTRQRTPDDISLPLGKILPKHGIEFKLGRATKLDPKKRVLYLDNGDRVEYDFLIIATGPRLAFEEIPGATENSQSICTTPHASETAKHVDSLVSDPGPIVVGATQGSSCFGPAYEFALLLRNELRKRGGEDLIKKCPMTFVTPEPYIGHLGLKGAGNSHRILEDLLKKEDIQFYTNCKISKVGSNHVTAKIVADSEEHKDKDLKLPSHFTMLIPPFRGIDVWKKVSGLTDAKGMIKINNFQQSEAYPNIFGVGVCVSIPPIENTLIPTGAPKTGYMIESQGTAAVKNIRNILDYVEKHPEAADEALFRKTPTGVLRNRPQLNGVCITDFGNSGAIFLTLPQYPPRRTDVTIDGKIATLAKIGFEKYFLHKIESGDTDPYYEKYMLHLIGVDRVTSKPLSSTEE